MCSKWSKYQSVFCGFVLFFVYIPTTWTQFVQVPSSPCPEIFNYKPNGQDYYGHGELTNPPVGQDIVMKASLEVRGELPYNYSGTLQLVGTNKQISDDIYTNQSINFEILFPTQNPLPLISSITVNDRVICENSSITLLYEKLTKVTLLHKFKPDDLQPSPIQDPTEMFSTNRINDDIGLIESLMLQTTKPISLPLIPTQFVPSPLTTEMSIMTPETTTTMPTTSTSTSTSPPSVDPPITTLPPTTSTTQSVSVTNSNFNIGCGKIPQSVTTLAFKEPTTKKGVWPWLVAIHYYKINTYQIQCAGTIISRSSVLSSANCFFSKNMRIRAQDITIFLGHHNFKQLRAKGTKIVNVRSIIIHPDYKPDEKFDSDIAIVKLSKTVEFSELIQPACLWSDSTDINEVVDQIGVVVSWERDENWKLNTMEQKRMRLPIISNEKCQGSQEDFAINTNDRTFCAGWRNGTDAPCEGDAGVGFMLNRNETWYIRGIATASVVEQGILSCDLYEYVVFTDVAKFSIWIQSNMV